MHVKGMLQQPYWILIWDFHELSSIFSNPSPPIDLVILFSVMTQAEATTAKYLSFRAATTVKVICR